MMEWFEQAADGCTWIVPLASAIGLWIARLVENPTFRIHAERAYFAVLFVVSAGTLRTMLAEDPCWFLDGCSLGVMIVGAVMPTPASPESVPLSDRVA